MFQLNEIKKLTHLKVLEIISSDDSKSKFVTSEVWLNGSEKDFLYIKFKFKECASANFGSAQKFKELSEVIDESEYTADQAYNDVRPT